MKRNAVCGIFLALVLLLCLIPSLGMLVGPSQEGGANEVLTPLPELRDGEGRWNTDYLSQLREYAGDHFFGRQAMISGWSELNTRLLHTSIADNVILGTEDWLYYGDTLEDYTGLNPMTDREIRAAARNLALVKEYCDSRGVQFLFTSVPNKNTLYPEHMPQRTRFSEVRNLPRLNARLEALGVPCLDMEQVLAGEEEVLYFTRDSHWNSKGAALGADAINAALGRESSYYQGPFHPEPVHRSDLYDMLYPTGTWMEDDQVYEGALNFTYDRPLHSAEDISIMTTAEGRSGSLVMFRDSFGNLLYPYLADSFGSALFSRSNDYLMGMLEARSADCMVVELVERNLDYLLQYVPQMPAPRRSLPQESGQQEQQEVELQWDNADLVTGYVRLQGRLPDPPEEDTAVLLQMPDGTCYEAFQLQEGGFALYVPDSVLETEGAQLTLWCGREGAFRRAPAAVERAQQS